MRVLFVKYTNNGGAPMVVFLTKMHPAHHTKGYPVSDFMGISNV